MHRTLLLLCGILLIVSNPASGWDFNQTRAWDIMDRAANDGDADARLLIAMALDDRISTIFDDFSFKIPAGRDPRDLYVRRLDHKHIYNGLMNGEGEHASKASLMVYALQGTFALSEGRYWIAAIYYRTAERIGEQLIEKHGLNPDLAVLTHDARAGKVASMRCSDQTPPQETTYEIERMLTGLKRTSGIARDYRRFIRVQSGGRPSMRGLDGSGCWSSPASGAAIIYPLAPFNFELNSNRDLGLLH